MMSLPSIARLHDQREKTREAIKKSKTLTCDCCGEEFRAGTKGSYVEEYWSPLIADKPSGMVTICPKCAASNNEEHGHEFGEEGEGGYFLCSDCGKLQIFNWSWESYATSTEDGYICQACAAKHELDADSPKWLTSEEQILNVTKDIEALQAYEPKHLSCIGGAGEYPLGVMSFRDTEEYEREGFDFYNKMQLGFGDGQDPIRDTRDCLLTAFRFYSKVFFCIGESGQFQSYGQVLVDASSRRKKARKPFNGDEKAAKAKRFLPAGAFPDIITRT